MSDRELLEQAATAYFGADGFEWNSCAGFAGCIQYMPKGLTHYVDWVPLEDDGDALRLAVKLSLMLDIYSGVVVGHDHKLALNITDAWHERDSCDSPGAACSEPHGDDPFSATRRAIVGAAAEIGKNS